MWGWCSSLQLPLSLLLPEPEGRPQETSPQGGNAAGPCVRLGWQPEPDLSHPAHNLPFQESSFSWELGCALCWMCWPRLHPARCSLGGWISALIGSPLFSRGLGGGVSGRSKPPVGSLGGGKRYVPKLLKHRKDKFGKETKSWPLPRDGGWGTRAREGSASLSLSPVGVSPEPTSTLGTGTACREAVQTPRAILHSACRFDPHMGHSLKSWS